MLWLEGALRPQDKQLGLELCPCEHRPSINLCVGLTQ